MALAETFDTQDQGPDPEAVLAWIEAAPSEVNLVPLLDPSTYADLAQRVVEETAVDEESRSDWWKVAEKALAMANAEREDKTYPWPNASNVKYPLVMTAALRFNAQAYPALVPDGDIVKCRVNGADPGGQKAKRAERVAAHMSWQFTEEMEGWEEDTDKLTMQLALAGTMHRKVWHDYGTGRKMSKLLRPGGLIVNDGARSLGTAPRLTERIHKFPDEIETAVRGGVFVDGPWRDMADDDEDAKDSYAPVELIEQHRRFDLDGDGYPEPYIVTVHEDTATVVRIVANWRPEDVRVQAGTGQIAEIRPRVHYVDYHFLPNPRGGYHSVGLGLLLGDLSESINSTINLLADAAHKDMAGGGYLGVDAVLPGGNQMRRPGEIRKIPVRGQDFRQAFVPEPTGGASPVLFQMLGLLIDAARELANVQDIEAQAGRSTQPATTTLALIEQGQMVLRAVFKRLFRSFKREFKLLAGLNAETVTPEEYQAFHDEPADPRADYDLADMDISPVADPAAVTTGQKLAKARIAWELVPSGLVNAQEAGRRVLEAAGMPDIEGLIPEPDPAAMQQAAAMQEMEFALLRAQALKAVLELQQMEEDLTNTRADTVKKMADAEAADELRPIEAALAQMRALKAEINAARQNIGRGPGGMADQPGDAARAAPSPGGMGGQPVGGGGDPAAMFGSPGQERQGMGGGIPPSGMGGLPVPR